MNFKIINKSNSDMSGLVGLVNEFFPYAQKQMGQRSPEFENFLSDRKIGHIVVDKPLLIQTTTMHRVVVTEAPRCAWITRWNNIPKDVSFQQFKRKVENIL